MGSRLSRGRIVLASSAVIVLLVSLLLIVTIPLPEPDPPTTTTTRPRPTLPDTVATLPPVTDPRVDTSVG